MYFYQSKNRNQTGSTNVLHIHLRHTILIGDSVKLYYLKKNSIDFEK